MNNMINNVHLGDCMVERGKPRRKMTNNPLKCEINNGDGIATAKETFNNLYYPTSILDYSLAGTRTGRLHPTQKPVDLLEYLIKTYTLEGEVVLDSCSGSGTTAIACINTDRQYICIEKEPKYYQVSLDRIAKHVEDKRNE